MRMKIATCIAVVVLTALLVHAWWRVHEARQGEQEFLEGIRRTASANAESDWRSGKPTYRILGMVRFPIKGMFDDHFREHGITAVLVGDNLTRAEREYSNAYNGIVRQRLRQARGSDLIEQFMANAHDRWLATQPNPRIQTDAATRRESEGRRTE